MVRKIKSRNRAAWKVIASRQMPILFAAFLLITFVDLKQSNAARIEPWNTNCLKYQKRWKKEAKHKAIAVTKVYSNGQGCGHSWNWATPMEAKRDALRRCQRSLKKNRPKSKDKCMIVKVE
jgi:hypothetical protein